MSLASRAGAVRRRLHVGMGTVTAMLAAALVVTGGLVLWGSPSTSYDAGDGLLRAYPSTPSEAWTLDDTNLPGFTGDGAVEVADQSGGQWLISYPSGFGMSYQMIDAASGRQRWSEPVSVGLGSCAFTDDGEVGCAVKLGRSENGFYLVDRDEGTLKRVGDLDDTVKVTGVDDDFVRVNQVGYQVSRRTGHGTIQWSRTFAATASPKMRDGVLTVQTADGASYVLDPLTGEDELSCTDCEIGVYPRGVTVMRTKTDAESVTFYPRERDGLGEAARTADGLRVVAGASTLPVLTGTGAAQIQETDGRYEVADPATGKAMWQISDSQLSKVHARPCGSTVTFARKDRSRVFFDLATGDRLGEAPPPDINAPDANLDYLSCVGASGQTVVFASRDQLTAFDAQSGQVAWEVPIDGTARAVDGYIVLTQGTSLSALRPS